MRKIKMNCQKSITFEEGCNLYLQNCKERNLREDTIRHYRQSYMRFYKYTTDGKVILEIAKMILEIGIDGTKEDFDRLLGYIAEAESHARCSWVDCEADADDLAEYYDVVLRASRGEARSCE